MRIIINGQPENFTAPLNLQSALAQQGYTDKLVAVARNGEFVPRAAYNDTALNDGDHIEIVAPMQGG